MSRTVSMGDLISLMESGSLFLLDIYAGWCHPCRLLDREIEALEKSEPLLEIVKIDYDTADGISDLIGVRSLPLLILFEGNRELLRIKGFYKAEKLGTLISEARVRTD